MGLGDTAGAFETSLPSLFYLRAGKRYLPPSRRLGCTYTAGRSGSSRTHCLALLLMRYPVGRLCFCIVSF